MQRGQRNAAFFEQQPGGRSLQVALQAARRDGVLRLRGRGLSELPPEVWNIGSVVLPEDGRWWETRETLERLDASENGLQALPSEVAALSELVELNLCRNAISQLPEAMMFERLARLADLKLSHNALRSLPDGFGAGGVPPLVRLHLAHNQLATFPLSLTAIRTLEELDASHNRLEALPADLPGLAALRTLLVAHNALLALPPGLGTSLATLDVSENRLLHLDLRGAAALRTLQASRNRIESLRLDGCDALCELSAAHNALRVLPELERCTQLATVDLSSNQISDVDGGRLAQALQVLNRFDLSNNALSDASQLAPLGTMPLVTLALQGNVLRGIPHAILSGPVSKLLAHLRSKLPEGAEEAAAGPRGGESSRAAAHGARAPAADSLAACLQKGGTALVLSRRGLIALPEGVFSLDHALLSPSGLLSLDASDNALAALPPTMHLLASLVQLRLASNALEALPDSLGGCSALELLDLDGNRLAELSPTLGQLSRLIELRCARNRLSRLPPQLWACARLSTLVCTSNRLYYDGLGLERLREAPSPQLQHLDLGENRLAKCPPLGAWPALREVHLQKNGMRDLSPCVAGCAQLQTLDLRDNDIALLPPELSRCAALQSLSIHGNPLRSIPHNVQEKGATAVLALLARRLG